MAKVDTLTMTTSYSPNGRVENVRVEVTVQVVFCGMMFEQNLAFIDLTILIGRAQTRFSGHVSTLQHVWVGAIFFSK